jgi:hypothetical protein
MLTECPRCYTSLAVGPGQSPRPWCPRCGTDVKSLAAIAPANTQMMFENAGACESRAPRPTIDADYGLAADRPLAAAPDESALSFDTGGPPERVFGPNRFWQATFLAVSLLFFGLAYAFYSPYSRRPLVAVPRSQLVVVGLFAAGGLAGLYGVLRLVGSKCLIYPGGFVYVRQGETTKIAWDQIRSVVRISGPAFRIAAGQGRVLDVNSEIGGFFALGNLIDERMAESQLPALLQSIEDGQVVAFGPVSADRTGIYCREHAVPWLRVLSLEFGLDSKERNWRKRIRKGFFLRINHEIQISIGEIRNYRLFEMTVLHYQPACQAQPLTF